MLTCLKAKPCFSKAGVHADSRSEGIVFNTLEKLGEVYVTHPGYPGSSWQADAYLINRKLWVEAYGGSDPIVNPSKGASDYYQRMEEKKKYFHCNPQLGYLLVIYPSVIWEPAFAERLKKWLENFEQVKETRRSNVYKVGTYWTKK
jgi:hypothetical protein